jgi:tRNA(Ile)-lysidine synthase TilS/MesJ
MGEDLSKLSEHCATYGITHIIHETKTYELAAEKIRQNSSFCSFFSRMRRGALYGAALEHGCNKVALGHHLDDAAESFFMNMIYNGQMRALAPKYKASNGLIIIRPLIQLRERQLAACALENEMPTIGDEMCPSMRFDVKMPHARASMKVMLGEMEEKYPNLFVSINSAFGHIGDDTFFDPQRFNV